MSEGRRPLLGPPPETPMGRPRRRGPGDSFEGVPDESLGPPHLDAEDRIRELEAIVNQQEDRLEGLVRIAANLGKSRDPRKAMCAMVNEVSEMLDADRTTIYEKRGDMLHGLAVQGETSLEVGLPIGNGIAGSVAKTGRPINLKDAYLHAGFDPKYDKLTGYRTRSMLVVPMRNPKREVIGVVQVLNKETGYFTVEDQMLLTALAAQAAITLEALQLQLRLNISNAELRDLSRQLQHKVEELEHLYENERAISEASGAQDLAERVLPLIAQVTRCEAAALFIPDSSGFGPVFVQAYDEELPLIVLPRVEIGEGILGKTASRGEGYVLQGASFEDQAVPRSVGGECDLIVQDAISQPLVERGRTVGAMALINRRRRDKRDPEADLRIAVLLAGQLARAVTHLDELRSAQQRDRMMTIGQMLSGVLHDLRGPMAIISGYSQLMSQVDSDEERAEMAGAIRRQVAQFNDMTREVMAFARGERRVFIRKVYLDKFVKAVVETLEPEFKERGVGFEVRQDAGGLAWFDESKMMRVVANIARNARQALGDTGKFTWTLRPSEEGGIVFDLEDNGPGIPEAIRDKLFEAFTTSGKQDGTGLGLAIVRRIVENHGGTVEVHTESGVGTRFTLTLPPRDAAEDLG